jgi:hypothetical protein
MIAFRALDGSASRAAQSSAAMYEIHGRACEVPGFDVSRVTRCRVISATYYSVERARMESTKLRKTRYSSGRALRLVPSSLHRRAWRRHRRFVVEAIERR